MTGGDRRYGTGGSGVALPRAGQVFWRLGRFVAGLLMIPVCVGVSGAVADLAGSVPAGGQAVPASAWALGGGYLLWLIVFFSMPRPVRTYVLAHELTHALWGALMGAKVIRMSVTKERGSVTLSKSNFLITLAPYFFPLYTVLVILAYYLLAVFVPVERYAPVWLGLVGFTWGFHFTFTVTTLFQKQTDIRESGHLFSYTIIYLFNVLGICLWIVLVSSPTLGDMVQAVVSNVGPAFEWVERVGSAALRRIMQ
ncbi:hypothetical protein ACFLSJ_05690 [Verrucomicrobiota bacterium]